MGQLLSAGVRWLAIIAVMLISAELFARVDDAITWQAPLLSPFTNDRLLIRDSLGVRGRPGYRYQKWRMNNQGFRGKDMAPLPAQGVTRVAILGASETFGLYESEGLEYPTQVQTMLDSLAPGRFEVVNVGLPGMSLSAMAPYYERVVAPIRPTFAVIYPSPTFYLEINPLPPAYTPPRTGAETRPSTGLDPELFRSRLAPKAREVLKGLVPTRLVTEYRQRKLRGIRASHESGWVWQSVPEDRMAIMERHLNMLVARVQATGATVVLVTHTNRFVGPGANIGADRRHLTNLMAEYYPRASERVMLAVDSVANAVIRRVAAEHMAAVVEVEGRIPPDGKHFGDYAHFTDAGAEVMASILATALAELAQGGRTATDTP